MEIVVLGAGTCLYHPERSHAGILVRDPQAGTLLLDSGDGTHRRLHAAGADLRTLDAIFYSHLHMDHVGGLAALLFPLRVNRENPRTRDLPLYGPRGFADHFRKLEELWGKSVLPRECAAPVHELRSGQSLQVGGYELTAIEVEHSDKLTALAFRVRCGDRVFAYSGDARPCPGLDQALRGAHVAAVECSFPEGFGTAEHLTAPQTGEAAHRAGVGELVVIHRYPECDQVDIGAQVADRFGGTVRLATDGLVVAV